jgi:hypothetical protein
MNHDINNVFYSAMESTRISHPTLDGSACLSSIRSSVRLGDAAVAVSPTVQRTIL